ncbi:hypothetical protein ACO1MK_14485, partial [Staphylococcus aureus]
MEVLDGGQLTSKGYDFNAMMTSDSKPRRSLQLTCMNPQQQVRLCCSSMYINDESYRAFNRHIPQEAAASIKG